MDLYLVRLDGTYARYTGVVSDPELTPVVLNPASPPAGAMQGMGEPYRDIPNVSGASIGYQDIEGGLTEVTNTGLTFTSPTFHAGSVGVPPFLSGTLAVVESDDVAHVAPRQAVQTYTFWKFTFATVTGNPTHSYAEFRRGDIISNTAPNTDPTP
jgi:hypothetical protein